MSMAAKIEIDVRSLDEEFAAWLEERGIDATTLTRREQAGLVTEWASAQSPVRVRARAATRIRASVERGHPNDV